MAKVGRKPLDYSVIERGRFWHYKLRGERTYHTLELPVRRNRKGRPTNENEALLKAAEKYRQREHELEERAREEVRRRNTTTLWEFIEKHGFYIYDRCPIVARRQTDKRIHSEEWARHKRSTLERILKPSPLASLPVQEVVDDERPRERITPGDIEDWKQWAAGQVDGEDEEGDPIRKFSDRVINDGLKFLSQIFNESIHHGWLRENPCSSVSKIRIEEGGRGIFTKNEIHRIFGHDRESLWGYEEKWVHTEVEGWHIAYTFGLMIASTGERPSAILKAHWRDIDLENAVWTVRHAKSRKARNRRLPLISRIVDELKTLREERLRVANSDFIFCNDSGQPLDYYGWFVKRWKHVMISGEFPETDENGMKRTPYSLKHSLISYLIDSGEDEVAVRELVGHSHGYGETRILTASQSHYKSAQFARRLALVPRIGEFVGST